MKSPWLNQFDKKSNVLSNLKQSESFQHTEQRNTRVSMHLVRYASVSPAVVHRLDFVHTAVHWPLNARARNASCYSTQWLLRVKPGVLAGAAVRSTEMEKRASAHVLGWVFSNGLKILPLWPVKALGNFLVPRIIQCFLALFSNAKWESSLNKTDWKFNSSLEI